MKGKVEEFGGLTKGGAEEASPKAEWERLYTSEKFPARVSHAAVSGR
jgi:hypothetical protein